MISDRPRHKVRRRPRMISSNPDIRIHHNIIFFMDHIHKRQPIPAVLLIELFVSGCWTTAPEEKINLLGILLLLLLGDSGSVLITDLTLDTHKVGNITSRIAQRRNEELIPKCGSVDTVVEQTNRKIVSLFNGMSDTFDRLGVGLGTLQETTVTAQNLVQRVTSKVEETLRGVNNWVVGKRGVGDDKVLLGGLKRLDEGKIGIVKNLVGSSLRSSDKSSVGSVLALVGIQQTFRSIVSKMVANGVAELFVLFLEKSNGLLKGFEQELFSDAGALGMFPVAFTVLNSGK